MDSLGSLAFPPRRSRGGNLALTSAMRSDHGVSLSLHAKDPDGLEFEIFCTASRGDSGATSELDLAAEPARGGIAVP